MAHVEAKLHGGTELVDVLTTRARGADETLLQLVLIDTDVVGNADHFKPVMPRRRASSKHRVAVGCTTIVKPVITGSSAFADDDKERLCAFRQMPLRQHLAFFDGGLVERIDAEEM